MEWKRYCDALMQRMEVIRSHLDRRLERHLSWFEVACHLAYDSGLLRHGRGPGRPAARAVQNAVFRLRVDELIGNGLSQKAALLQVAKDGGESNVSIDTLKKRYSGTGTSKNKKGK